jgi:hypothetical protein
MGGSAWRQRKVNPSYPAAAIVLRKKNKKKKLNKITVVI